MPKDLPVGVAQSIVVHALGEKAYTWSQAEAIFERYGISERPQDRGGWKPGGEDGWSAPALPSKLTPEQRDALAPYWHE